MNHYLFPEDIRTEGKTNVDKVHLVILRMLKIWKEICERHGIAFWLDYGTMLGAVRHKGFIPWDTEADIGMLRHDFEKLIDIIPSELPDDVFFQTKETDPAYLKSARYIEAKLRDKYSNYVSFERENPLIKWHNGIQIDIFIYDHVTLDEVPCLMNAYEKVLTGGKAYFLYGEIEELLPCDFEDTSFFIPAGYDNYLKRNYGNYLERPPLHERKIEEVNVFNPCKHNEVLRWKNKD